MTDDRVCVGALAGSFGVQGEVRLKSFCADPAAIASYGPLTTEDGSRSFTLTLTREIPAGFSARLSGVATKEQADALKGTRLFAPRTRLPPLEAEEYYHADLIGLEARDTGGAMVGHVSAVHNHGASDLLEISGPGLKSALLLPFTLANVPLVDLGLRRIVIDPPEGVLE